MSSNLLLLHIRHNVRLSGCWWLLKLQHLNLLLKGGDHCCPLLELEVLLLIGMLQVYDHVGALVHQVVSSVSLLTGVVPPMLGLAEAMVHNLPLAVLVQRRKCTTVEKGILMLQLPKLVRDAGVVLIV
jgi:hypothetical protein